MSAPLLHLPPQNAGTSSACGLMFRGKVTTVVDRCTCVDCLVLVIAAGATRLDYLSKVHGPLILKYPADVAGEGPTPT